MNVMHTRRMTLAREIWLLFFIGLLEELLRERWGLWKDELNEEDGEEGEPN